MAEKTFNDLYNQLSPMDKRYFDQQFSQNYVPGQENIMLSSQPAYEQMKAAYEAQQQIPEKGMMSKLIDIINPFSSASASEVTVPSGGIGNLNIFGISGEPTDMEVEDFLGKSTPQDLGFIGNAPSVFTPSAITPVESTSGLPQILAGQSDFEKNLLEPKVEQEKNFLEQMLSKGAIGGIGTFLSGILPQDPPEVRRVKDFYARNFGVNTAGSVGSGIMQGYNPVSGGFLNYMTGGRFGEPMQVGLGRAMQRRIENILGRKAPQTDASRAKVEELRNLQLQEMRDRAAGGESLGSIGKSTFSGKGGAFEAKPSGAYSKGFAGGR